MTEPTQAIVARGLSRDYGRRRALDAVNLEIHAGRIVALLGPNGAGKSTFLKLCAGMIEPTAGGASIFGISAREAPNSAPWRVACLLDSHEPPEWADGLRLVAMQAEASPRFDRAFADAFCFSGGIDPRWPYGSLSRGQRRRLLAGVVLATGADLILLDEPADGLDTATRRDLYDRLRRRVNDSGATAIVATHNIHDIERVADDVAILNHGRLVLTGSLEDLREQVREIEMPLGAALRPDSPIEILARRRERDAELLWARSTGGEQAIAVAVGAAPAISPVGLEDLYLALTQTSFEELESAQEVRR